MNTQNSSFNPSTELFTAESYREYLEAIKPFIGIQAKIYSLTIPTIVINSNGEVETKYKFTSEQVTLLRLADEGIAAVNARLLAQYGDSFERAKMVFPNTDLNRCSRSMEKVDKLQRRFWQITRSIIPT